MTNLFNYEAVTPIIRDTIEHSLRFFDKINDRLIDISKDARPDMSLPHAVDEMNKVCADYQDEHRALVARMEKIWRDTFDRINDPKNRPSMDHVDSFKNLFDPNEMLRLNRDVMNATVSFFFKTGDSLFKAFDPRRPITTPKDLVDLISNAREEYQRRHHELTLGIANIMRGAMGAVNPDRPVDRHEDVPNTTNRPVDKTFDLQEMIRLNREVIDNTVKFFLSLNENLLQIASFTGKPESIRNSTEILNRVCEDFRVTHQAITKNVLNTTRQTIENTFKNRNTKMNPIDAILDREEMFKLNQETLANTVKFFMNVNDELVRTIREPGRPVSLDTMIDEYQRIHRILTSRIEALWRETMERLHDVHSDAGTNSAGEVVAPAARAMGATGDATVTATPRFDHPVVSDCCHDGNVRSGKDVSGCATERGMNTHTTMTVADGAPVAKVGADAPKTNRTPKATKESRKL